MNLPPNFISTIRNTFKGAGDKFLADLPALVDEAARHWNLTDIQPASNLSCNFICYALSSNNQSVVLKIGVPNNELTSEMAALRLFNGEGAVQLLGCDEAKGFLLLERLQPGSMLSTLKDDEEATHIAADVMLKIQRPAPQDDGVFIKLSDWFKGFNRLRKYFDGGTGPLNKTLVEHAEKSVQDFFAEDYIPTLMHGDFHHYNILLSERGWAVIDPKGVIGPAGYEVGPFLLNPWEEPLNGNRLEVRAKKRISILSEHLGMERERIREWGIAHAVLSAWWGIEDNTGWEYSMACAEMLCSLYSA